MSLPFKLHQHHNFQAFCEYGCEILFTVSLFFFLSFLSLLFPNTQSLGSAIKSGSVPWININNREGQTVAELISWFLKNFDLLKGHLDTLFFFNQFRGHFYQYLKNCQLFQKQEKTLGMHG